VVLDEYFLSYALFEGPSTVCHEMWVFAYLSSIYWSKKMKEIQIHPAPQPGQPDWGTCIYCREMLEGEKVCCKNSERCHSRMPVNSIFYGNQK
jgi:hypothetical protein